MRKGIEPADIAVILRGDAGTAALFAQVLAGYGIPVSHDRRVPLERTRLGAGVLAAAARVAAPRHRRRAARLAADAGLRGGSGHGRPARGAVRRAELRTARDARACWEERLGGRAARRGSTRSPRAARGGRRGAARRARGGGGGALDGAAPPPRGRARRRGPRGRTGGRRPPRGGGRAPQRSPPPIRRSSAARPACSRRWRRCRCASRRRWRRRRRSGRAARLLLPSAPPAAPRPDGVLLADPLAIRARRFRAVFVCSLQDAEFPRRPEPEPFLSDEDRRGLARASGLVLPLHEDVLDRERSLFYAARVASRGRALPLLALVRRGGRSAAVPRPSSRTSGCCSRTICGTPAAPACWPTSTWAPKDAPTPHELRRAYASAREEGEPPPLAAPAHPAVLAALAARETEPARGIEAFAACGVRWLVEQVLKPDATEPDPEPMRRGSLAHAVLERTLELLAERTGAARLAPERAGRGARGAARRARRARAHRRARRPAPRGPARARRRPGALRAARGRVRRPASSPTCANGASAAPDDPHGPLPLGEGAGAVAGASTASTSGPAARRSCTTTRAAP